MEITVADIFSAALRIRPYVNRTPVRHSTALQHALGLRVTYKLENLQVSGSFKPRGGFNKLLKVLERNRNAQFIAPTAGGHGVGLSYAAKRLNVKAHILMPGSADPDRILDVTNNGASIQFFDSVEAASARAREIEREKGFVYVSAYNDREMIEGGGTIAVELLSQLANIDCVVCGVGGGGYMAGMALVLKAINPDITMIGVQQDGAPCIQHWFDTHEYKVFANQPTIAEGIGGMVEEDCLTLPYIRRLASDFILVSEAQIRDTLNWTFAHEKMYVEPSGIVGLTAIRHYPERFRSFQNIVTVITGGNMSFDRLKSYQ